MTASTTQDMMERVARAIIGAASHHAELVSSCEHLLACIDMCNEAGAPPSELDPEDVALIDETRRFLAKIGDAS